MAAVVVSRPDGSHELIWESEPDRLLSSVVAGAMSEVEFAERAEALGIDPTTR